MQHQYLLHIISFHPTFINSLISPSLFILQAKSTAGDAATAAPPKPNTKFSRGDLKRIKQQGPTVEDLFVHFEVETKEKDGRTVETIYDFIPTEVLGNTSYSAEPKWRSLPQMTYMEFYRGLMERNWTSKYYDPDAEPWQLQFFTDSGRFMRPAFEGYRALIIKADGAKAWVDIDQPGPDSFLRDYMGGGYDGAIWKSKRSSQNLVHPAQYGYNQVFEQLFQGTIVLQTACSLFPST